MEESLAPIGEIHYHPYISERKSYEIGYSILPEFRNQSLVTKYVLEIINYLFDKIGVHRVVAMCNSHNIASSKVLQKVGMSLEGTFKEELLWRNEWTNQQFYAIINPHHLLKGK